MSRTANSSHNLPLFTSPSHYPVDRAALELHLAWIESIPFHHPLVIDGGGNAQAVTLAASTRRPDARIVTAEPALPAQLAEHIFAQATPWILQDLPSFFDEVVRLLRPHGTLAFSTRAWLELGELEELARCRGLFAEEKIAGNPALHLGVDLSNLQHTLWRKNPVHAEFLIRRANTHHLGELLAFVGRMRRELSQKLDFLGTDQDLLNFHQTYCARSGTRFGAFLVAQSSWGRILGTGALAWPNAELAELRHIHVDPACRGQQLGRAILENLLRLAERAGAKQVEVQAHPLLLSPNGFFASAGFVAINDAAKPAEPTVRRMRLVKKSL